MIKNLVFMLIGGFLATAVLTVVALCEAAGRADRWEEERMVEDMYEEQDMQQEREENGVQ